MTTITDFPSIRPSLLLDFANSGRVDPRISCVRASTATCFGPDGKLRTVANNAPRIDFDLASGGCRGLLVEETRTNLLTYAADMSQGWVKGSAAQWSVGTGFNGSSNHVRVLGLRNYSISPDAACIYNTSVPVVAGTRHVFSMYLRLLPDSPSNRVMFRVRQSDGSNIYSPPLILTDRWARYSLALTIGEGITFVAAIFGTPGDTDVVNCELACGQFEQGEFATSFIPTINTAVTRAADALSQPGFTWTNWVSGLTIFIEADTPSAWPADATLLAFSNGTAQDNQIDIRYVATGVATRTRAGSATIASTIHTGIPLSGKARVAIAVTATTFASSANGSAAYSVAAPFSPTALLDRLAIGVRALTNNPLLGRIQRISIYPTALTAAQIQRLTA